jgi:hypothetical protein
MTQRTQTPWSRSVIAVLFRKLQKRLFDRLPLR